MHKQGQKTLIVGQAPAKDTVGMPAFSGKSGPKFAALLGVDHDDLWDVFDVVNLIDYYPGVPTDKTKRGDAFPMSEARILARGMSRLLRGRMVVMVGKNVARAFGVRSLDFFEWFMAVASDSEGGAGFAPYYRYCVVPHPSGISHFWNDPNNVERARTFMAAIPR